MQHYPLVTVVGGSGFVGRHVVKALAAEGYRVRVITRNTTEAEFLKTSATVGQIALEYGDITRPDTLAGKFAGSDAVINLISVAYERGRQTFARINVEGARAVAAEAKRAGASRLVHVSALGCDQAVDTRYGATKHNGEAAVNAEFPSATILRPSLIIGPEDGFFQRFGRMSMLSPFLPLIGRGDTRFQPILVTDVAKAVCAVLRQPHSAGATYALAGPHVYSFRELLELMARITNRRPRLVPIPHWLARCKAFFLELLPMPPMITHDQINLLAHDNIARAGEATASELGITPLPIEDALPQYLARYIRAA